MDETWVETEDACTALCDFASSSARALDVAEAKAAELQTLVESVNAELAHAKDEVCQERDSRTRLESEWVQQRTAMEGDIARLKLHCATLDARCQALRSCSTAPASAPAAAPAESNTSVKPDVEANTAVMSLVTQAGKQIDDVRKRVHLLGVAAEAADERAMAHEAETAACRAKVAEATNALARLLEERSRLAVDSRANQAALAAAKFETGSLAAHMDKLKQDLIESHRQRVALEDELEKAKVAMARAMAPVLSPIAKPRALRNDDAHEEV